MNYRSHPYKPTAALWTLVAIADVALVLASAGVLVLLTLVSVAAVAVLTLGMWRRARRHAGGPEMAAPAWVRLPVRD